MLIKIINTCAFRKIKESYTPAQAFADCNRHKSSVSALGIIVYYILNVVHDFASKIFLENLFSCITTI